MYSRDEVRALSDTIIDMANADAVEVDFTGGERSATRFANSNITVNMVQFDRQVSVTIQKGARSGSASTRQFDAASLKQIEGCTSATPGAITRSCGRTFTWTPAPRARRRPSS